MLSHLLLSCINVSLPLTLRVAQQHHFQSTDYEQTLRTVIHVCQAAGAGCQRRLWPSTPFFVSLLRDPGGTRQRFEAVRRKVRNEAFDQDEAGSCPRGSASFECRCISVVAARLLQIEGTTRPVERAWCRDASAGTEGKNARVLLRALRLEGKQRVETGVDSLTLHELRVFPNRPLTAGSGSVHRALVSRLGAGSAAGAESARQSQENIPRPWQHAPGDWPV